MENIQFMLDSGLSDIRLPSGEFKGPFYITKPCTVTGDGTTLWGSDATALVIKSSGVKLKNLHLEQIVFDDKICSVYSEYGDTVCENVEIVGSPKGFGKEDLMFEAKKQFSLGNFRADTENIFIIDIFVSDSAVISTDMVDVTLEPTVLSAGVNSVKIKIAALPAGAFIYGDIVIKSKFIRRMYISGNSATDGQVFSDEVIFKIDKEELKEKISSLSSTLTVVCQEYKPAVNQQPVRTTPVVTPVRSGSCNMSFPNTNLRRGERMYIDSIAAQPFTVYMGFERLFTRMDIDPYVFMLDSAGITSCDDDFVYFGNTSSKCGTITYNQDKSLTIDLRRVPEHIQKISFVYSIYSPGASDNFSKVVNPGISVVQNGKEMLRYTADDLFAETTIIFSEIYRHNSRWKMNTIGQGYREGLKRLCSSYGLIVS